MDFIISGIKESITKSQKNKTKNMLLFPHPYKVVVNGWENTEGRRWEGRRGTEEDRVYIRGKERLQRV